MVMKMFFKTHILMMIATLSAGGDPLISIGHVASGDRRYLNYFSNYFMTICMALLLVVTALSLLAVLRCLQKRRAKFDKKCSSKQTTTTTTTTTTAELQLQLAKLQQKVSQLESENSSLQSENFSLQQKSRLLSKENRQLKKKAKIAEMEKIHLKSFIKKSQDAPPKQDKPVDEKSVAIQIESNEIKRKTKRVTFAPYMVLESICLFDESGLLRDQNPTRKAQPKLSV